MGTFAETANVNYCLSYADQEKQTSVSCYFCFLFIYIETAGYIDRYRYIYICRYIDRYIYIYLCLSIY